MFCSAVHCHVYIDHSENLLRNITNEVSSTLIYSIVTTQRRLARDADWKKHKSRQQPSVSADIFVPANMSAVAW